MHLRIGRGLVAGLQHEKLTEQVFDVVNQVNHAIALLSDRNEIERVAELNLRAGRKAKASTAYVSACRHLDTGMALLGPLGWASCHALAYQHAACTFLSSQFDATKAMIAELLERAASKFDKAVVYRLKGELHIVQSEHAQAVDTALECLRLFGMDMQAHPTREEVNAKYEKIWRNLGCRSIESLIDLPRATARDVQAAMRVLTALRVSGLFYRPKFVRAGSLPDGQFDSRTRHDGCLNTWLWLVRTDPVLCLPPLRRWLPVRQARARFDRKARLRF